MEEPAFGNPQNPSQIGIDWSDTKRKCPSNSPDWTKWSPFAKMGVVMSLDSIFSKKPEWKEVQGILRTFHQKGWEALLAGGSVRDALLGNPPKDFDVAVSAPPEEVLRLFPRAKDQWKRYGVVFLPLEGEGKTIEITTFRKEHSYKDGRRPQFVEYTSSAKEDAKRRDFTVNALFYDIKSRQVLDFVDGLPDLKSRLLRTVGAPKARFEEDHLRPLRALRFAHQLQFTIDPKTQKEISPFAESLQNLSKERIYSELLQMFCKGRLDQATRILRDYSFFDILFPFKGKALDQPDLFWKTPFSYYEEPAFVWAVLGLPYFYNSPKELKEFLLSMKAPLNVAKKSMRYVQGVKTLFSKASFSEKLKAFSLGAEQTRELAQNFGKAYGLPWQSVEKLFQEFQIRSPGNSELPPPLVTGTDLMKAGYPSGRIMGDLLKKAYDFQLEKNISKKEDILRQILQNH